MNEKDIEWITQNWDKIDDKFKTFLAPSKYRLMKELKLEEHFVILLLDRQKPSVEADYSFDEERIGITRTGKIIWGFDSGCSCPSPWDDSFPDCYNISKTWKEFEVNLKDFDTNWDKDCSEKIKEIKGEK